MAGGKLGVFLAGLAERLLAMAAGTVAARAESDAAIHEAECLDQLEDAARQYDEAGKPHLAERLRRRAAGVSTDNPAAMATRLLSSSDVPGSLPAPAEAPDRPKQRRRPRRQAGEREE